MTLALWHEIRSIDDPQVRKGLLERVARTMAGMYESEITGESTAERMRSVSEILGDRNVPFEVEGTESLPVLTALACPYPALAERDRGICALERMMFSELVGKGLRLSDCRLDGDDCCRFEPRRGASNPAAVAVK